MNPFQVSSDFVRLHIDGEIVGKKAISSLFNKDSISTGLSKIAWVFCGGDDNNLQGYVHNHNVLPLTSSIMEYFAKVCGISEPCDFLMGSFNSHLSYSVSQPTCFPLHQKIVYLHRNIFLCQDPPLQLSIDNSSVSEIEEVSDGIWSIVGGRVSLTVDDPLS